MRKGSALQYLTILFTLCTLLLSCTRHTTRSFTTIEELNDSRITIGYNEGHSSATVLPLVFPKAKLLSFNENLTGYEAIRRGKIDAFAFDRVQMELAMKNGLTGVKILGDFGEQTEVGVGLSPVSSIPDLKNKINAFLAELRADGTLDDLYKRWVLQGEETMPAIPVAKEPRLHLRVGTTGIAHPYSYYKGTELTGFDIELARRFAAYLNADLEFKIYNYGSIITAARSGDIDCIMANLNATPERRESIAFSTPVYIEKNAIMVHDDDGGASTVKKKSLSPAHGNIPPQFQNMTLKYTSKEELQKSDQLVLGMHTGFVMVDRLTRELFPRAKIEYYKTNADMAYLVASGKLDGFINDEPVIRYAALEVPKLGYIHCGLDTMNIVACFQKNEKGASLRDEFNQYVKKWQEDGTLKKTDDLWLSNDEKKKVVDLESLRNPKGKKGTIRFATEAQCPPFDYIKDGKIVGYEIDVIARFCREAGYALTVQDVPFDSLIMGLETGMYDCVAACLSDTPANRESLNLSEALYVSELVMAVEIMDDGKSLQKTAEAAAPQKEDFTSPSDYNRPDVTLGVKTGTVMDRITQEAFPLAKIEHYNASPEMVVRVVQGKIDGYLSDEPIIRYIESTTPGITHLKERIRSQDYAFGFPKSDRGKMLCGQMNEFLKKIKADGTLEKIDATWFGTDKSQQKVDLKSFSGENGSVNLVTDATLTPFSYIQDSEYAGYEIDIAARFCREYGYTLKITDTRFASIIPGLVAGTYDMAAALIGVTDERKESLLFSDADYQGGMVLAVKKADGQSPVVKAAATASETNETAQDGTRNVFFSSLASSFEKTFVRESRWKLVANGIGITVLLAILSALFGTVLGFVLCGLRLTHNKIADSLTLIYIRLMQGLPMVVLLMILFYIVFAKTGLSGIWVAVIGFGMNFGAYVSEMIRTGILAVDKGQMEAALALGYPKSKAFVKMILPQAARHFLPVYQGEFISLVKMTSVVGYIAIQDLTKASDIIRSRTYEAFFPLITTAIIYFIISWLLTRILTALQRWIEPKKSGRM